MNDALLVLHIAGAGTWLGANIVQAVAPSMTARQGQAVAAGWFRVAGRLSVRLYMPAAVLILITGVFMVLGDESHGFDSPFVTVGFAMIMVGALFGKFIFDPGSEQAAQAVESGDGARVKKAVARLATFGTIDTLLLLFTITAMVTRLGE